MASATFLSICRQNENNPVVKFTYAGVNVSEYIISIPEMRRDNALSAGTLSIVVDNINGDWNTFLSNHQELTQQVQVKMSFGGFVDLYTTDTISFHNNGVDPDTIEDSDELFLTYGFCAGMPLQVTDSNLNDGVYTIASVTAGVITLIATDSLTDEAAGTELTLTNESITLYTGYVESVEFDEAEKTATLNCKDRISTFLDYPVQYVNAGQVFGVVYNAFNNYPYMTTRYNEMILSAIIWDLLTTYAKLDDTENTGNSDIDYASWQAWAVAVDNGGYTLYDICVDANGESVKTILMKIAQLTESIFWVGGDGKIKFKASLQAVTGQTYDRSDLIALPYRIGMEDRINFIQTKWAYVPGSDVWYSDVVGLVQDYENYGPTDEPFTYSTEIIDDRIVSHNSADSAELFMNEKLNRTAAPPRIFNVTTDLVGFVEDLGNDITLDSVLDSPYDDFDLRIEEISFNVMDWTANITGRFFWTAGELES